MSGKLIKEEQEYAYFRLMISNYMDLSAAKTALVSMNCLRKQKLLLKNLNRQWENLGSKKNRQ
ncbi:MAG: hypothetical protein ACLT5G_14905 [Blautia wexlerae]